MLKIVKEKFISWFLTSKPTLAELPIDQKMIALNIISQREKTWTLGR